MHRSLLVLLSAWIFVTPAVAAAVDFAKQIAPILEKRCVSCHNEEDRQGDLSLATRSSAAAGGDNGPAFAAGDSAGSLLLDYITGEEPEMPKEGPPLKDDEVALIRTWIDQGARWPKTLRLVDKSLADRDWWSLRPLPSEDSGPRIDVTDEATAFHSPVDIFVARQHHANQLSFSRQANRRTLLRRLSYDLIGLPPSPRELESYLADVRPDAYERQVDRLLASPHYGERWARHWLDVVHYGDTHGYDKDKLRPNAWPYRDYVIRAFNADKPYHRFVREQIAGDALWPDTVDGIEATGFLSAGPWDFIGHAEVPESKIDGKVARHLDRDDMVRTVFESLCSTTIGCAQCHNHKFDPITMQDYYNLQSVFASIDRADREYDRDPRVASQRKKLTQQLATARHAREQLENRIKKLTGGALATIDAQIAVATQDRSTKAKPQPEFGYHSHIESRADQTKWVQVDLGSPQPIAQVVLVGCHDNFGNIGAGFGFPVRFRIDVSNDRAFVKDVRCVIDQTHADYSNPGVTPQTFARDGEPARYIRVTATKLVNRQPTDYIFALGELLAIDKRGNNLAVGKRVTSLDSIEQPVRWRRTNLTDGYYFGIWNNVDLGRLAELSKQRELLIARLVPQELRGEVAATEGRIADATAKLKALPAKARVYAGCVHTGGGNFVGRAGKGPREIRVLHRGQVTQPRAMAVPATINIINGISHTFELPEGHRESARRVALANWIVRSDNPLTWRSIVNRIWQYHFGRAIADSPNDLGRMGQTPSHPQLLDWLAVRFRDGGQSVKQTHRLLVTSRTYRQVSFSDSEGAKRDSDNRFLWRMNRRKLEAEALRDTTLLIADRWDSRMGGPGFRDFVLERPEHSPHYEYHKHDPLDPNTHRRSIYRFLVRSQPQPFMEVLDCADPSQMVDKRNETVTALQSLAMLNNVFVVAMSEQFAQRVAGEHPDLSAQVRAAFQLALSRTPSVDEQSAIEAYAQEYGLANACRVLLNMNEFSFVD